MASFGWCHWLLSERYMPLRACRVGQDLLSQLWKVEGGGAGMPTAPVSNNLERSKSRANPQGARTYGLQAYPSS